MSRKIIIITRSNDNYTKGNNILSKAINGDKKKVIKNSFYSAFEKLMCKCYMPKEGWNLENFAFFAQNKEVNISINEIIIIEKWLKNCDSLVIPEALDNLLGKIKNENHNVELYEKVKYGNDDVYLFYFDKTNKKVIDIWQMLALIFKDCEINMQKEIVEKSDKHILYIHDEEWGVSPKNLVLMNNSCPEKGVDNIQLLEKLKGQFDYVAAFMHETSAGGIYINILNCKFGKFLSDKMGNLEESTEVDTFINLKKEMDSLIEKEMN